MSTNRPELCVGGVVLHDDSVLLIRRATEPGAGLWSVPGGRVEFGETMTAAVERELLEETGLTVQCGDLIGWVERASATHHFVIFDFAAELVGTATEPSAATDASEAAWVPLTEVAELPLVDGLADFLGEHGVIPLRRQR